MASIIQIQID